MKSRIWSLELGLVIGLLLAAVIASFVTLAIAIRSDPGRMPDVEVDRFGREQTP